MTAEMGNSKIDVTLRLPNWECDQCILQWTYRNGKEANMKRVKNNCVQIIGESWGTCNGECGDVETFRSCSDISISW